jgi:hypothetical protein
LVACTIGTDIFVPPPGVSPNKALT